MESVDLEVLVPKEKKYLYQEANNRFILWKAELISVDLDFLTTVERLSRKRGSYLLSPQGLRRHEKTQRSPQSVFWQRCAVLRFLEDCDNSVQFELAEAQTLSRRKDWFSF